MDTYFTREFKINSDKGVVAGYGAVFNNVDHGGDRIAPGAFVKSIEERTAEGGQFEKIPMLYQHQTSSTVGVWSDVREDSHGLKVSGFISDTTLGRDVRELARDGALTGLSIGYQTTESEIDGGVRVIKEAELFEVSIVSFPMNSLARISAVKSQLRDGSTPQYRDLEFLLRNAGLSRRATKRLMEGGFSALAKQDTELDEFAREMRELGQSLRSK